MSQRKQTCLILKEIRRQIAEANDIEFISSECRYLGDCLGTCPKCETELRYLEQRLRARTLAGKAITLAGISAASLAMFNTLSANAKTPSAKPSASNIPTENSRPGHSSLSGHFLTNLFTTGIDAIGKSFFTIYPTNTASSTVL